MFSSFKQLVRGVMGSTSGNTSARRAFLRLESLETRTLMSASPVTFLIDDSGNLVREVGASRKVVDTNVQEFERDRRGDVISLTGSDDVHVLKSTGARIETIKAVTTITANLKDGGVEVMRENGDLDEVTATGATTRLGRGVDDFQENATGAVDMLFANGTLEEWRGGRLSKVAGGVDDFNEDADGTIEVHHSNGEQDDWRGGKTTHVSSGSDDSTGNTSGNTGTEAGDDNGSGRHGLDG